MNFESFLKTFDKIEPLSNFQIIDQCKKFKIRHFKGVFMRNELVDKIDLTLSVNTKANECFILNLDHSSNTGTHWTCIFIETGMCYYFDSFWISSTSRSRRIFTQIRQTILQQF